MAGFAAVGLDHPKDKANMGGVMRAAQCYGARLVVVGACRFERSYTDTMKGYRQIPVLSLDDVFDGVPFDCVPVAVDLVSGAVPLPEYQHPKRAFYIFGPEHGTLGERILSRCRDRVMVPTIGCMNLAATVNVVLYDRTAKHTAPQQPASPRVPTAAAPDRSDPPCRPGNL